MKTKLIAHRINTIAELGHTPFNLGVEIDIRSRGSKLILHHDPFCDGQDFEKWLDVYRHQIIILNVKEEGLETAILKLLKDRGITNFFFLDVSFPFIVAFSGRGINQFAVRFSEYESIETVLNMRGLVKYVWVDCFTKMPLESGIYKKFKEAGFQICLVSPELLGRAVSQIELYADILHRGNMIMDMICTKKPCIWTSLLQQNVSE
ncbi:MAG: hypothetical protein K8R02_01780 [Anaerohalosphaeraceae bacterium]|nr:hypothetical protein [Anaerohalosphaeraceae bacterium]